MNLPFFNDPKVTHTAVAAMPIGALKGLRVVFINHPLRESAQPNTPPQGPGLMAARLRQYGADVSIIDLNAYRIKDEEATERGLPRGRWLTFREAKGLIERHFNHHGEPHVIALSGKITTLRWQTWVSKTCRKLVPSAFQISGGGLATEFRTDFFNWMPDLDAIGHSEGDDIMLLCALDVQQRRQMGVSDFAHAQSLGPLSGRERYVYHGGRPAGLDSLPFAAWDLLERDVDGKPVLNWYLEEPVWGVTHNSSAAPFTMTRSLTTVSSRGCPHACAFCFRGAQGERKWGIRSPEDLAAEVAWLIQTYNVDFVGFPDDNFAVSPKRCQALPAAFADLNFRWGTHTRLDECTPDRLEPMAESGCIYIGVGAESAAQGTLTRMQKGGQILYKRGELRMTQVGDFEFPTIMMEGIANCREVGIHTNATWMMAYPGETLQELQTSIAFIKWQEELYTRGLTPGSLEHEVALASVNRRMFTATWYPGTSMIEDPGVREKLTANFGIAFDTRGQPIVDDAMRRYVLELDDATKVLHGPDGRPLNFSAMDDDTFIRVRELVDNNQLEAVLDLTA